MNDNNGILEIVVFVSFRVCFYLHIQYVCIRIESILDFDSRIFNIYRMIEWKDYYITRELIKESERQRASGQLNLECEFKIFNLVFRYFLFLFLYLFRVYQ